MTLNIIVRSILIAFLVAIPSPFLIEALSGLNENGANIATFVAIYLLAFVGCLIMGFTHGVTSKSNTGNRGASVASSSKPDSRELGTVKWFNVTKGFGFITRDSGEDVFVHYRSVEGNGRRTLREGLRVRFHVVEGEKGLQAEDVSVAQD